MDKVEALKILIKAYETSVYDLEPANAIKKIEAVSTGLEFLDLVIGVGGFPKGKIIEIAGEEGSFKTALTLHFIAECNKLGMRAQFYNVEHAIDWPRLQRFGINPELTDCPSFFSAEDICRQIKLAVHLSAGTGLYGVIAIDSLAVLRPELLQDREQMRLKMNENVELAKLFTQFTDDLKGGFKPPKMPKRIGEKVIEAEVRGIDYDRVVTIDNSDVIFIFTNHMKDKPETMYGDPRYTPGGSGKNFNCDLRLWHTRLSDPKAEKDEMDRPKRVRLKVYVKKSRVSPGGGSCELTFYPHEARFQSGKAETIVQRAVRIGVFRQEGRTFSCSDFPGGKIVGERKVEEWINENDFQGKIEEVEKILVEEEKSTEVAVSVEANTSNNIAEPTEKNLQVEEKKEEPAKIALGNPLLSMGTKKKSFNIEI